VTALARNGYKLRSSAGRSCLRRRVRPAWTILLAVFTFPFGLLARLD
jgi:hypothetical protein